MTEQPIFTKAKCIAHAKKNLVAAKYYRIKGDKPFSAFCLSRAADWRGHAASYLNH
jgi:hypothetical protein